MKIKKKILITLMLVLVLVLSSVSLVACNLFGGNSLAEGTYELDRVYLNGQRVSTNHELHIFFSLITIEIDGNRFRVLAVDQIASDVEFRVRSGYIEQRTPVIHNNAWIRANGSREAEFMSLRTEDGYIVERHLSGGIFANSAGGSVYLFFSQTPSEAPPPTTEGNNGGETGYINENLLGRWYLTRQVMTGTESGTFTPGDPLWFGGYFMEFRADGTWSEISFWNNENTVSGRWSYNGNNLILTHTAGGLGLFAFVGNRTFELSEDGETLTVRYTRTLMQATWNYVNTFSRTPPTGGIGM